MKEEFKQKVCPQCNTIYSDGYTICYSCQCDLEPKKEE